MPETIASQWSDSLLDRMRLVTDPPADRAARALFESHNIRGITQILDFMARNDSSVDLNADGFELPQPLKDYFDDLEHFQFDDEEKAMLDRAADFFELYGPVITMALGVRSLLKQYAATKATNVLRMTTLLTDHTDRRITETFQFVLDVMQKRWYTPTGRGIRSIQKLRLIHALIRFRIKNGMTPTEQGTWDMAWGEPINQEDMIFANHTFSVEVLQGLEQAGFKLDGYQVDDYFGAWCLIGRALGVEPALLPDNYKEAAQLQQRIYARQFTLPNHNGPPLAKALVDFFVNVMPVEATEKSIVTIIKFFNGPDNYAILENNLGIDLTGAYANIYQHIHQELRAVDEDWKQIQGIHAMSDEDLRLGIYHEDVARRIIEFFSIRVLRTIFARKRGSKSTSFQIDDALANKWGLPGNEGIPMPNMPSLEEPKKVHPLLQWAYDLATWFLGLLVKVRDQFK